jgi:hypothetical protein
MIKGWMHDIALAIQSRSGATAALFVWMGIAAVSGLTVFIFLCVAGYDWLATEFGSIFAALIMAGVFLLIAVIAAAIAATSRRHARERAILERAARAHATSSWLLDPKILGTALQLGRTLGWQRLIPVALLGFLAAQWAREYRKHGGEEKPE